MEQYLIGKRLDSVFKENTNPKMIYFYKASPENSQWTRMMHSHKGIVEINVVLRGHAHFIIDGIEWDIKEGDFLVLNSDVPHEEISDDANLLMCSIGIKNICLKNRAMNTLIEETTPPVFVNNSYYTAIRFLMESIHSVLQHARRSCLDENVYHLMMSLMCTVIDAEEKSKDSTEYRDYIAELNRNAKAVNQERIERIREYIDANYNEKITLDELSEKFSIDKFYLCRAFKRKYGCTIVNYIVKRRIGEAQSLLLETDYPLDYIADCVGFSSFTYFTTQFKKYIGVTPLKYRNLKNF